MPVTSAGLLPWRTRPDGVVEVLIAHMGGPYWTRKDDGAWSIPKGEYDPARESARDAADREFREELGIDPPGGERLELGTFAYSSGKRVTVFAVEAAGFAASGFRFGTFELEWPPRSGRVRSFAEVDRAEWMTVDAALPRLVTGQRPALDALHARAAAAER